MSGSVGMLKKVIYVLTCFMPVYVYADYWSYSDPYDSARDVKGRTPDEVVSRVCTGADRYIYFKLYYWDPTYLLQGRCMTGNSQYNFKIYHWCDDHTHAGEGYSCSNDPVPIDPNRGPHCEMAGNPISLTTGNKYQKEVDYRGNGHSPLEIIRYYNSQSPPYIDTHLGQGWRHNYDAEVVEQSADIVITKRPTGRTDKWVLTGGSYISQTMPRTRLERSVDNWTLVTNNGFIETYNNDGQLISIENPEGQLQALLYDQDGLLQSVTDSDGRSILFNYGELDRLVEIVNPEGRIYNYTYDRYWRLSGVSFPDDTPTDELDNPKRQYHYEDSRIFALTGITDENGNREATWGYDEAGRANSSEHAGGVDHYALSFNVDGTTTVTNPLGKKTTYHFVNFDGLLKTEFVEGHPSTNCAASSKEYSYYSNGTLESKTDWNGNITTYTRDSNGREISRTEASETPQARIILTEWHPYFQKPTKITEPLKITEYTYDDQGRLLSKKESALQ